MKNFIYLFIVIVIVSCTVSIAYIHQPQEDAIVIIGTNTDSITSGKVGEAIKNTTKPSSNDTIK